jgi:protein-tyrosine phosphatase
MTRLAQISALALVAALAACGQDAAPSDTAAVEASVRDSAEVTSAEVTYEDGIYKITWTLNSDAPVDVSVTTSRDGSGGALVADDVSAANFTWTPPEGAPERRYFTVQPEGGEPVVAATRVLPLEGGRNFRDLGGYETADGQSVKWGLVFRSGVMDGLTDVDYDYLSDLGITTVCDFRASGEREEEPTEWRAGEIDYMTFPDPAGDNDMSRAFAAVLMAPDVTGEQVRDVFIEAYRTMHLGYAPAYTAMFDELANGDIPLAFNCSAGKDRTGVAAALVLSALGVPRETVVADYEIGRASCRERV